MVVPTAPVWVPGQRPLAPSVMSVINDKGDNEMILGLCTDLLAFALCLRKIPENLSRTLFDEEAVQPVITTNGASYLQMRSVELHSTSGKEKEGKKEIIWDLFLSLPTT